MCSIARLVWLFASSMCFLGACHAPTELRPADTPIAIFSQRPAGIGLFLVSVDGHEVRPVSGQVSVRDFDQSPEGTRIAFSRAPVGAATQLFTVRTAGGEATQLTFSSGASQNPSWSPDGSMLAYWNNDDSYRWGLMVIRADGSRPQRLANTEFAAVDRASWSPDGTRLVFSKQETHVDAVTSAFGWTTSLFIADIGGAPAVRLTTSGTCGDESPAWSPDGSLIAFAGCRDGRQGLFVVGPDGRGLRRVTTSPGDGDRAPTWAPDARMLAFERELEGDTDVLVIDVDGTRPVNLTAGNTGYDGAPRWRRR